MDQSGGGQSVLPESGGSGKKIRGDVVIRTMQDDISLVKKAKEEVKTDSKRKASLKPAAPVVDNVTARKDDKSDSPPSFPLPPPPPDKVNGSNKVVMSPPKKVKNKSAGALKVLVFALIVTAVVCTGVIGWVFFLSNDDEGQTIVRETPGEAVEVERLIPQSAVLLLSYEFDHDRDRLNVINAWENSTSEDASETSLLSGDPRFMLERTSLTQLHYMLLEGDSRPYLFIPHTDETASVVNELSKGEVIAKDGWYVLHAFDTDLFEQELSEGLLVDRDSLFVEFSLLKDKIGLFISPNMLTELRKSWGGDAFADGLMKSMLLAGDFSNQGRVLQLRGEVSYMDMGENDAATEQRLLEIIPSDVNIVRLGTNFTADMENWQKESQALDTSVLDKPAVISFLSELSVPYAYFLRERSDGLNEIGLVIRIPESLKNNLEVGDAILEEALRALTPMVAEGSTDVSLAFTDNTHNNVPLRYVNLVNQNQALDYAIVDDYLLIATSKEGMFALIDTATGESYSLNTDNYWQDLFGAWGAVPQAKDIVIGRVNNSLLSSILPIVNISRELVFGFSVQPGSGQGAQIQGLMLLVHQQTDTEFSEEVENIFRDEADDVNNDEELEYIEFE